MSRGEAKHRSGRRKRYAREMNHDGSGRYRSGNIHPASLPARDADERETQDLSEWTCPHGIGMQMQRGDCLGCNAEIAERPGVESMTGDERAEEVRTLLHERSAYRFDDIHARIEALVGRPVWTHEFVTDLRLMEEARGGPHPSDLRQHLLDSLAAVADGKPIIVVEPQP